MAATLTIVRADRHSMDPQLEITEHRMRDHKFNLQLNSRKDKEDVTAGPGIIRSAGKCYDHHRYRSLSHAIGPVLIEFAGAGRPL